MTLACEVDPRIPEVLVSDVTRVRQILFNLISNSMKFTPSGGRVDVAVTGHQLNEKVENHGHVGAIDPWMFHFTVRDTGGGHPGGKAAPAFPGVQPGGCVHEPQARRHGLGLAICHRLCEMLGGAIWLESEPGVGSNFEFTIKAAAVPNSHDLKSADEPPRLPRLSTSRRSSRPHERFSSFRRQSTGLAHGGRAGADGLVR